MLTYVVIGITVWLALRIIRSVYPADATGYLLVSSLIPLPLCIIGNSAQAAVFSIDICEVVYLIAHGHSLVDRIRARLAPSAGIGALVALSLLATFSGAFNYIFVDPSALKFYAYTILKFWQYALLAGIVMADKPNARQLHTALTVLITGIFIYEVLHCLHVSGILPLSGEQYFGSRVVDASEWSAAPFSDRTAWFLTSCRGVIGGTASINMWICFLVFESSRGARHVISGSLLVLSAFSVFAASSRSDIAGLIASLVIFAALSPTRRWLIYLGGVMLLAALYGSLLTLVLRQSHKTTELERLSELWNPQLRAEGSYADRSTDRVTLVRYLPAHPRDLLIGAGPGNFHWYQERGVTINFFGHNAYLHWAGELGLGGFLLLLLWCGAVALQAARGLSSYSPMSQLASRTCLALLAGRMVTGWGGESLFGTEGMAYYSLFLVGFVYLLLAVISSPCDTRIFCGQKGEDSRLTWRQSLLVSE